MKDELGKRMKENYEDRTRIKLLRRSYTVIRVDGKAFHTYTKKFNRPFDDELMRYMDQTAIYLCKNICGAKFAYVQSDEISILVTDFDELTTQAWFDNNLQKMCSISASMATSRFNQLVFSDLSTKEDIKSTKLAEFDSRVFQLPTKTEVENYFIWRQKDAIRNSIQSVGQSIFSQKELHGKSTLDIKEMLCGKGIDWDRDFTQRQKMGCTIEKYYDNITEKTGWTDVHIGEFAIERNFLSDLIPNNT